ncbi:MULTISPECIES: hypothetical protein [unclassified Streptomyces]|uniref:hypothetical protein n=1 Tax=unclassified Streptomyces TaxID=2593676 RepID=UPI0023664126|nr:MULTISPECIES: hypothetical protein [unclassified Streptomyces]MDF3144773.1 hypothetical protein [Streptomyces sp. T21Q-yed]WDF38003.1 hypothetical protein PBV52_14955 [Streptomyces sp. T12]
MSNDRRLRRLVVDERTTYLWSVRHKHGDGDVRRDVLNLTLDGVRTRIVFREGEGRGISDGYSYVGCVATGPGKLLNLREPGVVRGLVDEATARGLLPGSAELDGWELFDAVLSRAATATPAVPPGSPPGP